MRFARELQASRGPLTKRALPRLGSWESMRYGFKSRARGEMADALDSGSSGATRGGSNPLERTK